MGNLVFQATLGGQVNLVGPNTASTFNINVPALSGTMASIASVNNNGVIYVNSSGQPTTGTALVFDGTNLGVGQAPSAWLSSFKSLDIGTTSSFAYFNSGTYVYNNFYYNSGGNPVYKGNGYAQAYVQNVSGQHVWNIAGNNSSGAGASCTFTQAMTLDASGQLGIGATSPAGVLHATNGASPASRIIVGGGGGAASTLYTLLAAGNYIEFDTGGSERARIDSSGRFLLGVTSPLNTAFMSVGGWSSATYLGTVYQPSNSGAFTAVGFNNSAGTQQGYISCTGSGATTYVTLSDYRLKENIQPMTGALAKVQALNPVTYKLKSDGSDSQGFIAHELQSIVPDCVVGEKDAVDENGNPKYQGIDTSFLVATLTAAIKEQQAIITTLTDRISALEAK